MSLRRWVIVAGCACAVVPLAPSYAAGSGSIDYVETGQDGSVRMLYSVTGVAAEVSLDPESVQVSVNGESVDATAAPVEAGSIERTAVLALDVSQSMAGDKFIAAQAAAAAYLDAAPDDLAVGLVTFADQVEVAELPTTDHGLVADAIGSLTLSRATRLYDGVIEAVDVAGEEGARSVLVLSDGADTSQTTADQVITAAERAGVLVNVVALQQSAADSAGLTSIAEAAGGTVIAADDPAGLEKLFASQAQALAQQLLVTFSADEAVAAGQASIDASVVAGGQRYADSTFVQLESPSPAEPTGPRPVVPEVGLVLDERYLYAGLAAVGVGLAVVLALILAGGKKDKRSFAERHLAQYSATPQAGGEHAPQVAMTQTPVSVRQSVVAVTGKIAAKGNLEDKLNKRLQAGGVSLTAAEWLLLRAGVAVGGALVGFLLGGVLLAVVGLFFGVAGPWLFLTLKRSRRVKAFNSQLADTLQLMSGGLSAGLSLPQAVDTVVREGSEPMSGELKRALIEQRLGVEIEDALGAVAERMDSKDFAWIVMAVRIQREVGGNLAELLLTVAKTLREREYLRRQVLTLSAEGRLSAWILGGLPPGFVAYLAVARPDYLEPMVTEKLGWLMSGFGLLMLAAGAFWLKKTVKVEV